jgi:hypothetical protein
MSKGERAVGLVAAWAMAGALALSGCGGGGGEAAKSAATIAADARRAATAASSLHVAGTAAVQGQQVPIDLRLGPGGTVGTGSFLGTTVQIIRVRDSVYVRGAAKVLGGFLGPKVAARIGNHWLQIPAALPQLAQFAGLTDKQHLVDQVLAAGRAPTKAATRTVTGQRVIPLAGFGADGSGTLDVAAKGTPYPVQLAVGGGTLTFSGWNSPVVVAAPTDVVALSDVTR